MFFIYCAGEVKGVPCNNLSNLVGDKDSCMNEDASVTAVKRRSESCDGGMMCSSRRQRETQL